MLLFVAVNSRYIHTNIGVRYFYHLCRDIYPCQFLEFNINQELNEVAIEILRRKPKYIAISTYIWNSLFVKRLIEVIKKAADDIRIILGGPEVYLDKIEDWNYADLIVRGEGEQFFLDFSKSLAQDKEFTLKNYQHFDLGALPFPYMDEKIDENKVYYYESSRGCPFSCSYCMSSLDKEVRFSPLEKVFDEIKILFDRNVRLLKFVDRTFNIDKERAIKIIEFCKRYSKNTQVHLEIEPSLLDNDLIEAINASKEGLFRLEIGIQSFKPETLKAIQRSSNVERIDKNIKKLMEKKKGIVHLDLIAGLPQESFDEFKRSLDRTILYLADEVQLGFLKMLKGTKIRDEAKNYNYKYLSFPPYEVISNSSISYTELYKLKKIESIIERLYNRRVLSETLRYIFKRSSPSEFFERLSNEIDLKKDIRGMLSDLYQYFVRLNLIEDPLILKNLFRFDILKIYPEEYLPPQLKYSQEEREKIKRYRESNRGKIPRNSRVGLFDFNVEQFISNDSFKKEDYFHIFYC
ncbi:MAG: DUF4080 domain-containing protein [bacterium]